MSLKSEMSLGRAAVGAALCALLVVAAGGCRGGGDQPPATGLLIDHEPPHVFLPGRFFEEVWTSDVAEDGDRVTWNLHDVGPRLGATSEMVRLVPGGKTGHLTRDLNLMAREVDEIHVDAAGLIRGKMGLLWASRRGRFNGRLDLKSKRQRSRALSTYVFDVSKSPDWHGRITRLRVRPTTQTNEVVSVGTVRAVRRQVAPELWPTLTATSWKVRVGDGQRDAWVVPSGASLERRLRLPEDAGLSFDLASIVAVGFPVKCELWVVRGKREEKVFEQLLPAERGAGASSGQGWRRHRVDLAKWGGREIALSLRVHAATEQPGTDGRALIGWGVPRIESAETRSAPDVVLISLDTLRADRLSLYGYSRRTSPNLDRWAERHAMVFENAISTAPWTLPSHASMLTGVDAVRHGVNYEDPVPEALVTVAEQLRDAGYVTLAVTGGGYLDPEFGLLQGFERVHSTDERASDDGLERNVDRALDWLEEERPAPLFLLFHTYEAHGPFRAREPYYTEFGGDPELIGEKTVRSKKARLAAADGYRTRTRFYAVGREMEESDWQEVDRRYDAGVAYLDAQIGRLLEALEQRGRELLVIVTSDHGEALGEKDLAAHAYLYDFNLRVPMLVRLPGEQGVGVRVERQVSIIDVAPTILDVLGLAGGANRPDGRSLAPFARGDVPDFRPDSWAYAGSSSWGLALRREGGLKFLFNDAVWAWPRAREELYQLSTDPAEESDLSRTAPASELDALRATIEAHLDQSESMRVRWRNDEATKTVLTLRGPGLTVDRVKGYDAVAGSQFEYSPGNHLHWTLPAGAEQEIRLEGLRPTRFELFVGADEDNALRLELAESHGAVELAIAEGRVVERSQASTSPITLVMPVGERSEPVEIDDELARQLEALGYIQ